MYAIIGLGNPGSRYRRSRHNVGFQVVEELSSRFHIGLMADGDEYVIGTGTCGEAGFFVVKPMTYMNRSGIAVRRLLDVHAVALERLLVVCDDSNLPLGKIRIRRSGTDGGHNGLASIIDMLGSDEFPRLRVGIGAPPAGVDLVDFVLQKFTTSEEEVMTDAVHRAVDAVLCVLSAGVKEAMNDFN